MPIIIFVLGLLIGSFLNVVILRMNTGRSIVRGRSICAHCSRPLAWYELIPVFSFLGLRGKCRTCTQPISFQYALVELSTALVFVLAYTRIVIGGFFSGTSWLVFLFACIVASLLMVIAVYDVRHKIIPDTVVLPFILLSLVALAARVALGSSLWGELVGGVVVALPFFLLWYFSKGRAMGFGDVKLMLGVGWLLGLSKGYSVILLSFWIGGIVGLFLIGATRRYKLKSQVPFGPFIIIAVAIVGLWGFMMPSLVHLW